MRLPLKNSNSREDNVPITGILDGAGIV